MDAQQTTPQIWAQKQHQQWNKFQDNQPNNNNRGTNNKNISIVVPYIQGLGERFKRMCNKKGIQVHFKGTNTIKKTPHGTQRQGQQTSKEWGNIQMQMPHINCPEEYIGEYGRTLEDRLKEHLRAHPPSTTIATPQDTQSVLNVSLLSTGIHKKH